MQWLWLGLAGILGTWIRHGTNIFFKPLETNLGFPIATITVNVVGCFLMGVVFALAENGRISPEVRSVIATGLLGALTTFSALALDFNNLGLKSFGTAMLYLILSLSLGFAVLKGGIALTSIFFPSSN